MYVYMYVCVHYMEGAMYVIPRGWYVFVYMCPTWRVICICASNMVVVCVHTHMYIPFRYNPQVGHTYNAYPAPGRMDTLTFQNTHIFSTHSPCRTNAHMYIPPSRQDTHYPLRMYLLRRANTIVSRKYAPPGA